MRRLKVSVSLVLLILCRSAFSNAQEVRRPVAIVAGSGTSAHSITWVNLDHSSVDTGNTLLTSAGSWGNGASSSEVLDNGTAGYVEMTVTNDPCACFRMFGLGSTGTGNSYTRINFAIYLESDVSGGGYLHYSESGSISGVITSYSAGDVLKVSKDAGGTVTYLKNGSVWHTSGTTASTALYANAASFNTAVSIENLTLSSYFH